MLRDCGGRRFQRAARHAGGGTGLLAALLAAAGAWPAVARAQNADATLDHATLEDLMKVPLWTPSKMALPIREAPSVGTMVTREQIDTFGWLTLNDILFRQPGFAPAQDYERVTVGARGLYEGWNNNHLLTLMDGVPFNNATNGFAYTWDVLPLMMVDSVEIIRGPGSALYGTSATNGVVAMNTRAANNDSPLEGRLRLGSAGRQTYEVFGGYRFAPVELVATYGHRRTRGNEYDSLDGSGRTDAAGAPRSFATNDERKSHYVFAKAQGQGAWSALSAQLHYQAWEFQTGHGWLYLIPDEPERAINDEARLWVAFRPRPLLEDRLSFELVLMGQHHEKDYRIKYLPTGAQLTLGGATVVYPDGVIEDVVTTARSLFTRAQLQYRAWGDLTLLVGAENTVLLWLEDDHHSANVDLNSGGSFQPFPGGEFRPLRSTFEKVIDEPINNLSLFAQLASGPLLRGRLTVTGGLRYDLQSFDYTAIQDPGRASRQRSFDQLSPRLGAVLFPHEALVLKLLAERAFRAPSPSELFVANSLLGSSNTERLLPEQMSTITVAADVTATSHLTLRADLFLQRFENQIAFSASQNLSANIYSRTIAGAEAEVLFEAPLGQPATSILGGFANYTLARLLSEDVVEPMISPDDRLTWAPEQVFNLGLYLQWRSLTVSTQGHYQGRVLRRESDRFAAGAPTAFSALRPASVAPWFQLDARIGYRPRPWLGLAVQGTNLLDSKGALVKPGDYPFDFRIEGLRVLATLELRSRPGN